MKYLHIEPLDSLFFRDGKPFTKGEESVGHSMTLPPPSVIWGAMFTTLLFARKVEVAEINRLSVKDIYLYNSRTQNVFIPAPLDIFIDDEGGKHAQNYKANDFPNSIKTSVSELIMPNEDKKNVESAEGYFMPVGDLIRHYPKKNNYYSINLNDKLSFSKTYLKVGIARDKSTRTAEEGALYNLQMVEYADDWSFIVAYESEIEFPSSGILRLGGEAKTASFETIECPFMLNNFQSEINQQSGTDLCKLYFQSLTFIPSDFFQKLNIEASMVGKPVSIGGFDISGKPSPKPMLKAVPAGSIYILSSDEAKSISEWRNEVQSILNTQPQNKNGFGVFQIISIQEVN